MPSAKWVKIHRFLLKKSTSYSKLHYLIESNGHIQLAKPREKDLFRFICNLVTSQQLSTRAAQSTWDRLNVRCTQEGIDLREFCKDNDIEKFKECGISRNKALAMQRLNKSFEDGIIDDQMVLKMGKTEVINLVTSLWGLGRWSADMILIGYCGDLDIWSSHDSSLERGIGLALGDKEKKNQCIIESFSPYRTLLSRHIWRALGDGVLS